MKMQITTTQHVSIEDLVAGLVSADPKDFAEFWFQFSVKLEKHKTRNEYLHEVAEFMAPLQGGLRKQIFNELNDLIKYYEVKAKEVKNG